MKTAVWLILLCVTVAGCAHVAPHEGFGDLRQTLEQRTGHRVHWNSGTPEDAQAAASMRELLSSELDPDAAVQVALLNNRNLQATYEQLGVAQAQLVRAGLLRNPAFHAEAKFHEGGGGTVLELAFVQSFSELLQLAQRKRLAASELEEAKSRVAAEVLALAGAVRRAFLDHQSAVQMLELRRTTLAAAEASVALARALHDAGNITDLDFASERALHERAKLDLSRAESDVTVGRERLNALMGLWGYDAQWRVSTRLPDPPEHDPALESIERDAIERSFPLAAAKQRLVRAAESLAPARRNAILDDLEVGVAAEREPGDEWAVGPSIGVPLPLFDQGQAAGAIAESDLRAARERYTALAIETRAAARAAAQALRSARDRALFLRRVMLPLRQEVLDETQKQYNAMQVGAFQLIRARQDQIDTAAAYVESLRDYWMAQAAVDQIAAGGTAPADMPAQPMVDNASRSSDQEGH